MCRPDSSQSSGPRSELPSSLPRCSGSRINGEIDEKGRINPLQLAVLARAFPNEFFYLPGIPAVIQQAIAMPLAALGRRRGFTADPAGLAEVRRERTTIGGAAADGRGLKRDVPVLALRLLDALGLKRP